MKFQTKYLYTACIAVSVLISGCSSSGAESETEDFFNDLADLVEIEEPDTDTDIDIASDVLEDEQNTTSMQNVVANSDVSTALAYSNGYTLSSVHFQSPFGDDEMITFTVDTTANSITNDDQEARFREVLYDNQGRVSEIYRSIRLDVGGDVVTYNSDGTVATVTAELPLSTFLDSYEYANGNLARESRSRTQDGVEELQVEYVYINDTDGNLMELRRIDKETGQPETDDGWSYILTDAGRISEVSNIGDTFSLNASRWTFSYDDNGNIASYEAYRSSGELIQMWTFTYVPNVEPIPNLMGFLFSVDTGMNGFQ